MFSRRAASEFPNDNPELHDGLVWQSDSVTGHALPTLRLRQLTGTLPKVIGPAWEPRAKRLGPVSANMPVSVSLPVPVPDSPPPSDPVLVVVQAPVADIAVPEPVTEADPLVEPAPVVAAEPFVESAPVAHEAETPASDVAPPPTAFDALVAALSRVALDRGATRVAAELPALLSGGRSTAGIADSARAKSLIALAPAWRAALDGGDLAGCGDQPLDMWSSELLATLLSAPGEREALRRALRRHGVAAFGMLVAA